MNQMEQDIRAILAQPGDAPARGIASWYTRRDQDKLAKALAAIDQAEQGGPWDAKTRRRVIDQLQVQRIAKDFARSQRPRTAPRWTLRPRPTQASDGSRPLSQIAVTEHGRTSTNRAQNALSVMEDGSFWWAPRVLEYVPLLRDATQTRSEAAAVDLVAQWAADFAPLADRVAQLDRAAQPSKSRR